MGVDAGSNAGSTEGPILLPTLRLHACHIGQSVSLGTVSFGGVTRAENVRSWGVDCFGRGVWLIGRRVTRPHRPVLHRRMLFNVVVPLTDASANGL